MRILNTLGYGVLAVAMHPRTAANYPFSPLSFRIISVFLQVNHSETMNKKIYFAGSIRGGRVDAALYQRIIQYINKTDVS